jgi:type III secretion protein N (ATPase)
MLLNPQQLVDRLSGVRAVQGEGRLRSAVGLALTADLPGASLGELCVVERASASPLECEVVGFGDHGVTLLPLGTSEGLAPDARVTASGAQLSVRFGPALLGRVLDGLGRPADGLGPLAGAPRAVMQPQTPAPIERPRITRVLATGVRALDAAATLGEGQRIGLFAGAGVGKSSLLGQVARQAEADVFVACLVGERSRELNEFLQGALGTEGLKRGVVVCETGAAAPLLRVKAAHVASAIAEGFRDEGKRVLLLMDSVTRFARAAREVGLAAGEAPARRGYPPSVFARLPELVERSGPAKVGSITALYTVLVEGDDLDEPIADELRGLLDGHVVLSRELSLRGQWPAVDVPRSLSRLMDRLVTPEHRSAAERLRMHLARYEQKRDMITLGAYRGGDPALDDTLSRIENLHAWLRQRPDETYAFEDTLRELQRLV